MHRQVVSVLVLILHCKLIEMEFEDKDLVGVEYPGRVVNADNMIRTLGGLTNISKVVRFFYKESDNSLCDIELGQLFYLFCCY